MADQLPFDTPEPATPATGADLAVPPRVWFLSADDLAATRDRLAQLTRRAARRGFTGGITLHAQPATRSHTGAGGIPVTLHGFDVTLTGTAPHYAGWRFLAAVDNVAGQALLRYPPGADTTPIPNADIHAGRCDHCHTSRDRTKTMLVQHDDTGEIKQVGSSCLADFLGVSFTPVFLDAAEVTGQLGLGGPHTPHAWDLASVVAHSWAVIERYGWTSAAAAGGKRVATRDLVGKALVGGRDAEPLRADLAPLMGEALTHAHRIIADMPGLLTEPSGYQANLRVLADAGVVTGKHLGLAASIVPFWQRAHTQPASPAEPAQQPPERRHVGTVGEKITLTGTLTTAMNLGSYSYYGPDRQLLVLDCGDAIAKTITSAGWAADVHVGDTLTVTGTVKAHDSYHDQPQTVLTRTKLDQRTPATDTPTPTPAPAAPRWETVTPLNPQARFQAVPVAVGPPAAPPLTV